LNQGRYLEETLRSVLLQGYPNLEYVVMDGGSTDESVSILERYEPWLEHWESRPDGGHYEALNQGFARTSGDSMAWINSDDKFAPGAFGVVASIFHGLPEVEWLTSLRPIRWAASRGELQCRHLPGFCRKAFLRGEYLAGATPFHSAFIQQESTFWRRSLWQRAGGRLETSLHLAGDFELWSRFYRHTDLYGVTERLGGFRVHSEQQTAHRMSDYVAEARQMLLQNGGVPQGVVRAGLRKWITRLPVALRQQLTGFGWAFEGRIIVRCRRKGGWRIVETAV
jgi:hypothetical protein